MSAIPELLELGWLESDPAPDRGWFGPPIDKTAPYVYGAYTAAPPVLPGAARYVLDELAPLALALVEALEDSYQLDHGGTPLVLVEGLHVEETGAPYSRAHGGIAAGSLLATAYGPFEPSPIPTIVGWSQGRRAVGEWALAAQHALDRKLYGTRKARRASARARDALIPAAEQEWAQARQQAEKWAVQARQHVAASHDRRRIADRPHRAAVEGRGRNVLPVRFA